MSSSEIPIDALQTEVALLKRVALTSRSSPFDHAGVSYYYEQNVELRMEKLSSRDPSPMQNLCVDMSELVTTTKLELAKHTEILAADSDVLQNQLSELTTELTK
jgi:hypothetical protein